MSLSESVDTVLRGVRQPPQRFLGWLFDRVWVEGGRYGCYNQQPYLTEYATARERRTGFDWTLYQVMLSDHARIAPYRRDIEATVPGRTVLEIGPGPAAVLTRIAVEAGAKKIIAVDGNPWAAEAAARRLRRDGVPESRAKVVAAYSDDLTQEHTDGLRHFDVLILETYHAIASQEQVIETIASLRALGFSFDKVISRGFTTYVAPARAPRPRDMTAVERALMRWPARADAAAAAMRSHSSSLHGDVPLISSLLLAEPQTWQRCDLENGEPATTATELVFELTDAGTYGGLLFWNDFWFHGEMLNTLDTPTCWGVFFVPLPIALPAGTETTTLRLATEEIRPQEPSALRLRASVGDRTSPAVAL